MKWSGTVTKVLGFDMMESSSHDAMNDDTAQKGCSMSDWLQLCDDIDDGEHDDGLEEIARAIQSRRDVVHRRTARRLAREIQVGDRVMLTNRVTPRYLEGCSGTVLKVRLEQGAAVIKLDSLPTHRGRPSADGPKDKLLVPFIHIVKIDDDVQTLKNTDDAADIGDDEEYDDEVDDEDDDD